MHITMPPVTHDTPAVHFPYDVRQRVFTEAAGGHRPPAESGLKVTADGLALAFEIVGDLTGVPRRGRSPSSEWPATATALDDRDLRLRLLARKYGRSGFTAEDEARLEILTTRLRRVLVRVTEQDVSALESVSRDIESSRALRLRLQKKYGG
jgi:hypothetical protein